MLLTFKLLQICTPLLLIPLYIRVLGVNDYALFIQYVAISNFIAVIVNMNLETLHLRNLGDRSFVARIRYVACLIVDRCVIFAILSCTLVAFFYFLEISAYYFIFAAEPLIFNTFYAQSALIISKKYGKILNSYIFSKLTLVVLIFSFDDLLNILILHTIANIIWLFIINRRMAKVTVRRYRLEFTINMIIGRNLQYLKLHYRLLLQKLIQLNVTAPKIIMSAIAPDSALVTFEVAEKIYTVFKLVPSILYQYIYPRVDGILGRWQIILGSLLYCICCIFSLYVFHDYLEYYFAIELGITPYIMTTAIFFVCVFLFYGKINIVKFGNIGQYEQLALHSTLVGTVSFLPIVTIVPSILVVPLWICVCEVIYCVFVAWVKVDGKKNTYSFLW